jgi:Skp family chaperone for outer membrane proteins
VSKRVNRTGKGIFRQKLKVYWGVKDKPSLNKETLPILIARFKNNNWEKLVELFDEASKEYNQTPHRRDRMFMASPDFLDSVLFHDPREILIPEQILGPNDDSPEAKEIAEYKGRVLEQYAGSWPEFFIDWRKEQNEQLNELLQSNEELLQKNKELEIKVTHLVEIAQQKQREEEAKKERAFKRKNKVRQNPKAYISYEEFHEVLQEAKNCSTHELVVARVVLTLTLLYLTGLRVSNLLL